MNNRPNAQRNLRTIAFLLVVTVLGLILVNNFWPRTERGPNTFTFSYLLERAAAGDVQQVKIRGERVEGVLVTGEQFVAQGPAEGSPLWAQLSETLREQGAAFEFEPTGEGGWILSALVYLLPVALIIAFWVFMMRRMQQGGGAMQFGQSRAKLANKEFTRVTFSDVAGINEVLDEMREVVEYLREPGRFARLGARIPKGVLLVGPPGTGKTLIARSIAGEASVPFFSITGSDFVEMFVGVGAARVRDMFKNAKASAPCIVFIDEIDAVGRKRGAGLGGGHDEREQTLNQLLGEMDGFEHNTGVIVLAATNRPDVLDPALLRPGRFDRKIAVPPPDMHGREAILKIHLRNKKVSPAVDLGQLAQRTPGFVGADIENLCNEAALLAARQRKEAIESGDFDEALDRVLTGLARKGMYIKDEEKKRIAYHEAGHALLHKLVPQGGPLHKVSIIPRGTGVLGMAQSMLEDKYLYSKQELLGRLTITFGGRAAEEVVFEEQTTGAHDDLRKAADMAKRMVVEFGMSDALGPMSFAGERTNVFLGEEIVRSDEHSEEFSATVDREIQKILREAFQRAKELLTRNRDALERVAQELLRRESLSSEDIDKLLADVALQPAG